MTGASGYVGGRLVAALESAGRHVRCVTRRPELAAGRFGSGTEVVAGDVLDADSMRRAMAGVGLAYYLVHSLGSRGHFEQEEERAARSFVAAAQDAGVRASSTWAVWRAPMSSRGRRAPARPRT